MNNLKLFLKTSALGLLIILSCAAPSPDNSDSIVHLSFSPDEAQSAVIRLIDDAEKTIYVALYGFDNEPIADSLVLAQRRGVEIKMVTEFDSEHEGGWQKIIEHRIPLVLANTGGIMHNKYFIVDGKYVLTGSTNLTEGMLVHFNNMIIIKSPGLAKDFKRDFDVLWARFAGSGKSAGFIVVHNPPIPHKWPETVHQIGGFTVQAYFTPYKQVFSSYKYGLGGVNYSYYNYDTLQTTVVNYKSALNVIIPLLKDAKKRIWVMVFAFTDRVIADELMKAKLRGLDVRIWMDYQMYASQFNNSGRTYIALREKLGPDFAKICRRPDGGLLHHKALIIDDAVVLGSLNFSSSAVTDNDENFLVIKNAPQIAGEFEMEAMRIDQVSHPIPPYTQ